MTPPRKPSGLTKADFEQLSDFRHQIRRFERFSENAAKDAGLTPLQYLLLLHIKGYPGREWASVGELAERLQAQHHGVVALVTRCEELGLVARSPSAEDRRVVEVRLTGEGEAMLIKLAAMHRAELRSLQGTFVIPNLPHDDT
ncbi:MarR family transcriptional regulator [Luteibacter aegosomaticola]|uniref:MarR family winged helix-turn-helix transcriptional regulator n=1 Tax=Luteibacter aegosomaticola TaxID=2911538 RepID=UPI001FFAE91C|nr:MarR family transcriptional regulator [Luteibacter aegosomaticola]UPG88001.1 MarR family transcriptional regulator [Luteibacter aegosomaticola]